MSTIISKHKIKLLKLFLVSPTLEKVFLLIYVVTVILLSLSNKFGNNFSNYALGKQFMNIINKDAINSATDITDIANWITNDLVPAYFTDQVTVNKPLFPIYLLKSQIQCSSSDSAADCSVINRNLKSNSGQSQIIKTVKGHYGTYAISDVYQIDRDINSTALATLNTYLQDTWLDSSGTFVAVQLVCYNDWNQVYIEFSISFEWNTPEQIVARNIAYDISSPGLMHESYFVVFFSFFVIQLIISVMKVLFEFSISPNRFTFAGHLAHFTVQAVYAITVAVTLQQDKLTTTYSDSLQSFASIEKSIKNMTITNLLLNLLIIFYPFRLFTLLAWNKYLATPIKLFVVLYRTIPGIMIFGLAFMTLWVCFSLASYLGLRQFLVQVQSYKASFLNYFIIDFSNTAIDNTILNSSELTTFQITWALNNLALGGLLFFAVAIIVDMIRRSFDQEVPAELPHQQELQAKQTELEIKFDKFLKELSSIFGLKNKDKNASSFSSEEKMVIWLEHKMGFESEGDDVIEQLSLSKDPIKIMVFYKPEEVEEFLKYLFRLKPNLLTSQAGSKFRIVYETKFEKVNSEKNNIETLLDWLKGVGCRVPFLLFTKAELERDTYIHIKKKYPALFVTEEKAGALKFCRMEGKLDNLGFKLESNDNKYIMLENSVSDISVGVTSRSSIE